MKATPGYFVLIPISEGALGLRILLDTGLHGAVVPADTHLNTVCVAHLVERGASEVA